jgi:chitin disaccharide deacetylase
MRKSLIVNADDFGLHRSISSGIEKAARQGLVTSISCVSNMPEAAEQIKRISGYKGLGVGIHLNITDGRPVSAPGELDFLIDADGRFKGSHIKACAAVLFNMGGLLKIREEFAKQIERLLDLGIKPDHIDSHGHIHMLPGLFKLTVELAQKYKINFVRCPAELGGFWTRPRFLPVNILGKLNKLCLKGSGIRCADHVTGWESSGRMNKERLCVILGNLKPGINELIVHPGEDDQEIGSDLRWDYSWRTEMDMLTDGTMKSLIGSKAVELVNFADPYKMMDKP